MSETMEVTMPRPHKCRLVSELPDYECFRPDGIPVNESIVLSCDEYEVIRLVDFEQCTHAMCAKRMGISRTTVTEIYGAARYKLADCLVNGKILEIRGGNYRYVKGKTKPVSVQIEKKERNAMRVAVTYENGQIFQHFGRTETFKLYDLKDDKIIRTSLLDTNGQGHGALASVLKEAKVDVLICGGIGQGARDRLAAAGIQIIGGCSGQADLVMENYRSGKLQDDPEARCGCHHHEGEHHCGHECHHE